MIKWQAGYLRSQQEGDPKILYLDFSVEDGCTLRQAKDFADDLNPNSNLYDRIALYCVDGTADAWGQYFPIPHHNCNNDH